MTHISRAFHRCSAQRRVEAQIIATQRRNLRCFQRDIRPCRIKGSTCLEESRKPRIDLLNTPHHRSRPLLIQNLHHLTILALDPCRLVKHEACFRCRSSISRRGPDISAKGFAAACRLGHQLNAMPSVHPSRPIPHPACDDEPTARAFHRDHDGLSSCPTRPSQEYSIHDTARGPDMAHRDFIFIHRNARHAIALAIFKYNYNHYCTCYWHKKVYDLSRSSIISIFSVSHASRRSMQTYLHVNGPMAAEYTK